MIIDLGPNLGSNHLEKNCCTVRLVQAADCKLLGSARLESKQRSFKNVHFWLNKINLQHLERKPHRANLVFTQDLSPGRIGNWKFFFYFSRGKKTGEPG